jgi:spore coat polysaccharide biosynthesis predicted glycosyltransferase SpsG
VDKDNITTQILIVLKQCSLPSELKITVVMGATAPWIKDVQQQANEMPWITEVVVGINNMAELMANSDLAIGAAGSTSWERCCLGLPTVMICMAENQYVIAKDLHNLGAAISIQQKDINKDLPIILNHISSSQLKNMQYKALQVTQGLGVELLLNYINSESN